MTSGAKENRPRRVGVIVVGLPEWRPSVAVQKLEQFAVPPPVKVVRPGRSEKVGTRLHPHGTGVNHGMNSQFGNQKLKSIQKDGSRRRSRSRRLSSPSDTFLWLAIGSMVISLTMQLSGKRHASVFVGQWAPTFLLLGVYNKLVKQLGSDRISA